MAQLVVFDDADEAIAVLTDFRSVQAVRTGAVTTLERIGAAAQEFGLAGVDASIVRTPLAGMIGEGIEVLDGVPSGESVMLVSGRCLQPKAELFSCAVGEGIRSNTGRVVAYHAADASQARMFLQRKREPDSTRTIDVVTVERPWDVVRHRMVILDHDLKSMVGMMASTLPAEHVVTLGDEAVRVDATAVIDPCVVLDARIGPVVIAAGASVGAHSTVQGPAFIGPNTVIAAGASVRSGTSIGPYCKVGGEVSASIIQGYSNKAHDGYLGDSWVGEWVNIGAGSDTSNLLNTYGEVSCRWGPRAEREKTGLRYLGSIIGDHGKLAIGTRLMTGTVLGTATMS
ncbi:MAG: hypothetical protein AAGB34_07635, partial [Planctomycetota bacterium]